MGLEVLNSGKVRFNGSAGNPLEFEGQGTQRLTFSKKTFDFALDFSSNNQENQSNTIISAGAFPAGSIFLGIAAEVVRAIATSGAPTTIDLQVAASSSTPLATFAVTSNAVAVGVAFTAANLPQLQAAASGLYIGFTGGTTPAVTAGRIRCTVFYATIAA